MRNKDSDWLSSASMSQPTVEINPCKFNVHFVFTFSVTQLSPTS
jgi:hypothetical protein